MISHPTRLIAAILLLASGISSGAGAAPLGGATLSVTWPGLAGATFVGTVTGTTTSHGLVQIGAAAFPTGAVTASPTNPATLTNFIFVVSGAGGGATFLGSGTGTIGAPGMGVGNLRGAMAPSGYHLIDGIVISDFLPIPLKVGAPVNQFLTGGDVQFTVLNHSWTANTANLTFTSMNLVFEPLSATYSYFFHVALSGTSNMYQTGTSTFVTTQSITLTQMGTPLTSTMASRVFSLVTPTRILTSSSSRPVPMFTRLTVQVVPEAGTLLMLGSGALGLLLYGRLRARG